MTSALANSRISFITEACITIRGKYIQRLVEDNWLNDEIINVYSSLINLRSAKAAARNSFLAYTCSTYFFKILTARGYHYDGVRRWTTCARIRVLAVSLFMVPVNIGLCHWVLTVIEIGKRRFIYIDSMTRRDVEEAIPILRRWLRDEVEDKYGTSTAEEMNIQSWESLINPEYVPRQYDSGSRGVFCLINTFITCAKDQCSHFEMDIEIFCQLWCRPRHSRDEFELRQSLNATDPKERWRGVKRVVAAMTQGRDVSSLFEDVIKNVTLGSLAVKKLVYLYVINYARKSAELVILVIDTFVKDAFDPSPNPLIRALSLRTMGLIHMDGVTEYLMDPGSTSGPLHKGLADKDPYVRKTAAVCVAKLYDTDPDIVTREKFIAPLQDLLSDGNPMTVANAVAALAEISEASNSPRLLALTAQSVLRYLPALGDCTECGQVFVLDAVSARLVVVWN